jgi:hypothetical protein
MARDPAAFVMWLMRVCAAVVAVAVVWTVLDGDAISALLSAGVFAVLILPDMLKPSGGLYRWQAVITDRRLIYRTGDGTGYEDVPLSAIEILEPRDPEEILADPSEEARKMVKLLGERRIRDRADDSIGIQHGERRFCFETGKRKARRLRDAIAATKGTA